ncbi:MAG: class I SAM-dependent methyltransferase [Thermoleophilia bacterium]|nr:class I SAM-dependent methyltransferase [Thermoleophilia bacterium]
MSNATFWDERYRARPAGMWSGNPNPQLVAAAGQLRPGAALDVGCGEGADVIWLAQHGWRVTGLDLSQVALDRATEHAAAAGDEVAARTTWVQGELTALEHDARFDLVTMHYVQLPPGELEPVYRRAAELVAPGGSLLVVGHDVGDHAHTGHGPSDHAKYFTGSDVTAMLEPDDWAIEVDELRPRTVLRHGETMQIHDVVVLARRS